MTPWRVALVVQRYGLEVSGGAELHARWLAERLQSLARVQVFTTCATDFTTWADAYPPGDCLVNGVPVRRFPVDEPRAWAKAQQLTKRILRYRHTLFDELAWMKAQGPYSTPLLEQIRAAYADFDLFIFFTYLYAPTYFGLPLVSDKAVLVPTAHEDPYLGLALFRPLFHLPRAIVYNTLPEQRLVQRVTGNRRVPSLIAGVGINLPASYSAAAFRQKYGLEGDFLLYVGRINESKNIPALLEDFARYRQERRRPLKLVLLGKSHLALPSHPDIVAPGFVGEEEKFGALAAATLVVAPSLYESLSMLALEAWTVGRPVLANGRCAVLKHQCRQSNGGLYYTSFDEFAATLDLLLEWPELRRQLGQRGQQFVERHYAWDVILARYQALFSALVPRPDQGG